MCGVFFFFCKNYPAENVSETVSYCTREFHYSRKLAVNELVELTITSLKVCFVVSLGSTDTALF